MRKINTPERIRVAIRWIEKPNPKTGEGYAVLRWTGPDGPQQVTLGRMNRETAETHRVRTEAELRLGHSLSVSSSEYTVSDLMIEYVAAMEASSTGDSHKARIANDAEAIIRHLGQFACADLSGVHTSLYRDRRSRDKVIRARRRQDEDLDSWLERRERSRRDPNGKPVSSTCMRNEIATLRRAQTWGQQWNRDAGTPLPLLRARQVREDHRPPRRLTELEVRRLVDAAGRLDTSLHGLATLVEVLAWSGRRPVAVFGLHVGDCHRLLDRKLSRSERLVWWRADKAGTGRGWAPLTEPALQAILQRLDELGEVSADTLLWTTSTGTPWKSNTFPHTFRRIRDLARVDDVVPYDLRKHACAQLMSALATPHDAIRFSGHKTVELFLKTYAYALEGGAEDAAASIGWSEPTERPSKEGPNDPLN